MKPTRIYTGYHENISFQPNPTQILQTNCKVKEEVFASLEYISEIESVSKEFLINIGHKEDNIKRIQPLFRAFIRQAKTFYEAAELLHHRASPLNYYYCFLNLVKAYICIHEPDLVSQRIDHGLSAKVADGNLSKQSVKILDKGVFPILYQKYFNSKLPSKTEIGFVDALGYSSDIAHEYTDAGFGQFKSLWCHYRVCINNDNAYPLISIGNFDYLKSYISEMENFEKYFSEINITKNNAKDILGIGSDNFGLYKYFESKEAYKRSDKEYLKKINNDCYSVLKDMSNWKIYDSENDFFINLPIDKSGKIKFNELFSVYLCMFFLGSLVRYNPDYVESLLASKDSWIIERFIRGSPITFLLHISNLIRQKTLIYKPR
jgi:hypothetical protein